MNEHDPGIQAAKIYTITFCFWNLFWCLCVDVLSLSRRIFIDLWHAQFSHFENNAKMTTNPYFF